MGKLDCLEHLTAKGANLNAQDNVRRGPAAACRRGVWGLGSERGEAARRCPAASRAGGAPLVPLRPSAATPRRRPAAGCRPLAARLAYKPAGGASGAVAVGAWGGLEVSLSPQTSAARRPARRRSPACVGPPPLLGRAR